MKFLFVIPARKGSKGLPGKNIRLLKEKPLVLYSIQTALSLSSPEHICVTTDDATVKGIAESSGIPVPFIRPFELTTDDASTNDVLRHALDFYEESNGKIYDALVLLQPTSPLRSLEDVRGAIAMFSEEIDMVMSVHETKCNPYFVLFEEEMGYLKKCKEGDFASRQALPKVYQANGAVYVVNSVSLRKMPMSQFPRIKKFEMDPLRSVDIDTIVDFEYCEFLMQRA